MSLENATRVRRPRRDTQLKIRSILDAGKELFLTDGYTATSMDAVALKASVSKRTVYGHFGSKEELFAEIVREMCAEVLPLATASSAHAAESVSDTLTRIGAVFLTSVYTPEQVRLMRTVISEAPNYPQVGQMMYEGPIMTSRRVVVDYFDKLVRDGQVEFADTEFAAAQFTGMLKTDLQMRLLLGHEIEVTPALIDDIARKCVDLFLHGALKR